MPILDLFDPRGNPAFGGAPPRRFVRPAPWPKIPA